MPAEARPARTRMQRLTAYAIAFAASATTLVAFSAVTTWMAEPLVAPRAGAAPAWSIEVTSAGSRPATVLVYGKEAGIHLVRVPAATSSDDARIVPARLARGEVHLMSLSFTSLRAHASSPRGMSPMSWSATAPIITAFDGPQGTGVRTFW